MASEKPSTLDQVRAIFAAHGRHDVTYYAVIDDVVAALDAAYRRGVEQGLSDNPRAERKAAVRLCRRASEELSRLKRHDAAGVADTLAGQIECGRHRKEDK